MIEVQSRVKCNCKDKLDKLYSALEEQELEITRLNNIINEMEKWLERVVKQELIIDEDGDYSTARAFGCSESLRKLRELKEKVNDSIRIICGNKIN